MGRAKHSAKTGGAGDAVRILSKNKKPVAAPVDDSVSETSDQDGFVAFEKNKNVDSDNESEEVLNLNEDVSDDDSSEDDSAANSDDDEDEDEDDEEIESDSDEDNDLNRLVNNLPTSIRQKVLRKDGDDDDDSEEGESDDEEKWGKKKQYWAADTADLEIGQEFADAEDEEAAAQDLFRKRMTHMSEKDFRDDDGESDNDAVGDGSDNDDIATLIQKNSSKNKKSRDKVIGDLELVALGSGVKGSVQVEHLTRDTSHLSKEQKLAMISAESPELLSIVADLKECTNELRNKISPIRQLVQELPNNAGATDDVVEYLVVKQQLLLSYCTNVVFYLYMKSQGQSVKDHPVMRQLLELRYVMEKMRPLDTKLKYQVDRLLKMNTMSAEDQHSASLKPNLAAFNLPKASKTSSKSKKVEDESDEEVEDEEVEDEDDDNSERMDESEDEQDEDEEEGPKAKGSGLYKAPKLAAVPYKESETQRDKREEKLLKARKKLKNSEIMETLRDEFSTAPEASSSTGMSMMSSDQKQLREEEDERREFEEERFVRMTMTRKEKNSIKKRQAAAERLDNIADIGDIGEFEDLSELVKSSGVPRKVKNKQLAAMGLDTTAVALQKAVSAFAHQSSEDTKQRTQAGHSDDMIGDSTATKKKKNKSVVSLPPQSAADARKSHDDEENDNDMSGGFGDDDDEFGFGSMLRQGVGKKQKNDKRRRAPDDDNNDNNNNNNEDFEANEGLIETFAKKKREFLAKKKEHYTAEARYGGSEEMKAASRTGGAGDDKRAASYEIIKNRGLVPHRKKSNSNGRVKKREAYGKALVSRGGQVREHVQGAGAAYGGELTGIKSNIARSRKIGN